MVTGTDLERGIRKAMARQGVSSLSECARRCHIRRDTMYGWFRKPVARISPESIDKLVAVLGSEPGDPWYDQPTELTLDPETRLLVEAAVERAFDRFGDRLIEFLDAHLARNGPQGAL